MDALIQALADIEPTAGERAIAPNSDSCQVCNNCEGWENESVTRKDRTINVDIWPKPGFELKTDGRTLIHAANNGCLTCSIFLCALRTFLPTVEDDLQVTGWLPMPKGSLPVLSVKLTGEVDTNGLRFDFFTTPGKSHPDQKLTSLCSE